MAQRIPYPIKGVDENWAFADQPPLTSREELNMVGVDPTNGRTRGSQRSGLAKWCPDPVVAGQPIREIATVKQPVDLTAYSERSSLEVLWSKTTNSRGSARAVRIDRQRNSIWLEDTNVLRGRNPDGEETWMLPIPVEEVGAFCRILEIDEYDTIYTAVSAALKSDHGHFYAWGYTEEDKPPTLLSEMAVAGVVADIKWHDGYVYLAVNDHDLRRSYVKRVVSADAGAPEVDQEWQIPYPTNAVAIRKDGSVITASPPNATRLYSASGEGQSFVSWTPKDLKDWQQRVWSWFDASDIDGNDSGNSAYEDLDRIPIWLNKAISSSPRQLWDDTAQTKITDFKCFGAELRKKAVAGLDALFFDGGLPGSNGDGFHSHASGDSKNAVPDSQFGVLPGTQYSDPLDYEPAYAIFLVFRPAEDTAGMCVISNRLNGGAGAAWALQANYTHSVTVGRPVSGDPVTDGTLALWDSRAPSGPSPASGPGGQPIAGKWTEAGGTCLVTILHDNHMNSSLSNTEGYRSAFRINGQPIDRWEVSQLDSRPRLIFGAGVDVQSDMDRFNGYLCEIIVLRYNPLGSSATSRRPVWGPAYPDVGYQAGSDSELERIEGYLAWKWGIGPLLENDDSRGGLIPSSGYVHPFGPGDLNSPPDAQGRYVAPSQTKSSILTSTDAVLAKWTPGGALAWAWSDTLTSGIGSGLAVDEENDIIFSVGPYNATGVSTQCITRWHDKGDSVYYPSGFDSLDSFGEYELGPDHVDVQVDAHGNLWVPLWDPGHAITKVGADNLREASGWGIPGDFDLTSVNAKHIILPEDQGAHSIAVPREEVDYGDESIAWPDELWVASSKSQDAVFTVLPSPSATGSVTIGTFTYQLKPTGTYTGALFEVLWNSATPSSLENLYHAINGDEDLGTFGPGTPRNPLASAVRFDTNPTEYAVWVSPIKPGSFTVNLTASAGLGAWVPTSLAQDLTTEVAHKISIVEETQDTPGSPRIVVSLAVAEGYVKKVSGSGVSVPAGSGSIDQSSAGALSTNGVPYAVELFGRLYLVDGTQILRYTPRTDVLEVFVPDSDGAPPKRPWLAEVFRGRLVLFSRDNPWDFWMSKAGEPEDWNYYPAEVTADQATFGSHPNSTTGPAPDIINGFAPITDDVGLFLCDSSLHRLTGDPMAGGQIDFVSSITGGAPGRAWTIDPHGIVYIFGSRGGVYRINPFSGSTDRISRYRIERATEQVDFSTHRIRMAWDHENEGLLVSAVPYGAGGSLAQHWFWCEKLDRWSTFQFGVDGLTTVQPTALGLVDGDDPDDRTLLLGGEDGYLRRFDPTAFDDDGVAIDSSAMIGPLVSADADWETRFGGTTVILGEEHSGALLELFASATWTDPGTPRVRKALQPGRNKTIMDSVRGPAAWMRLRNPWAGQRWSYEVAYMEAAGLGEAREQ